MNYKKAALVYLEAGLSVIPVGKDKKPLISWKPYTQRRPTKNEVNNWWTENPKAGVGIVTGKISNLTVIDVEHGGTIDYLPKTKTVRTGGGGYHFYYRYTDKFTNAVRIRELTDIRNDGGYVVAPPSRHKSKRRYAFLAGEQEIKEFPIHLFLTESIKKNDTKMDELLKGVTKGGRNDAAARVSGYILTKTEFKAWENIAWPAVKAWNQLNDPPLPERELRATYESIAGRVGYKQDDIDKEIKNLQQLTLDYQEKLKDLAEGKMVAISSGFKILDTHLNGGWKNGELILIGARPSVGKTSLALTFALNAALAEKNVLFFSIEMSSLDIYERMLSFVTNVTCNEIIQGTAKQDIIEKGFKKIEKLNISFAELSKATSVEVIEVVKKFLLEKKIDLIVVDYLQFLRDKVKSDNSATRIGQISKNLKMLARMTGIPVICPTQLNRKPEERAKREARLSDLRESGDLEQDADVVILVERDIIGDNKDKTKLILAKNRKGQTGDIFATFDLRTTRFKES